MTAPKYIQAIFDCGISIVIFFLMVVLSMTIIELMLLWINSLKSSVLINSEYVIEIDNTFTSDDEIFMPSVELKQWCKNNGIKLYIKSYYKGFNSEVVHYARIENWFKNKKKAVLVKMMFG